MLKKIYKLGELTLMKNYKDQERDKHTLIDLFWECTLTCNEVVQKKRNMMESCQRMK